LWYNVSMKYKYKVTGVDKESSTAVKMIVSAKNSQKAADAARAKGMYVSSVEYLNENDSSGQVSNINKTVQVSNINKTVSSMTPQELFWTIVGAIIVAPLIPGILVLLIYLANTI